MFHRFSSVLPKARSQTKGVESASVGATDLAAINKGNEPTASQLAKRQKTARACDRCRLYRVKCGERKPCAQCIGAKVECVVTYPPSASLPQNKGSNNTSRVIYQSPLSTAHPKSDLDSKNKHDPRGPKSTSKDVIFDTDRSVTISDPTGNLSFPPSTMGVSQDGMWATTTPLHNVPQESSDLPFFAGSQPESSPTFAFGDSLFPQLPHPVVPPGGASLALSTLSKTERSHYLRLFWDVCHPLMPVMSETEFAELDTLPPPMMFDDYSTRSSLADSMIALGMQHSHATGLVGRVLGLQQQPSQWRSHAAPSLEGDWPGFEYFGRCRENMRSKMEVGLDGLRCHVLMTLYLIKGNAFYDAYNLLGITVRKAYIAKLHRTPPVHLSDAERIARMQLWSTLLSLDVQCSLQLDMPPAVQKSLIKSLFSAEDALARYVSPSDFHTNNVSPYAYSTHLARLAVTINDARAFTSTIDLVDDVDDGNSSTTLEGHAVDLLSALQNFEIWHDQLPPDLLLARAATGFGDTKMVDLDRSLAQPQWLRRQAVFMELHYHNAYVLLQRPFIRLLSVNANGKTTSPARQQPYTETHISSAYRHATTIIEIVYTVCSSSDVLYGWSKVLQPLWNATLTVVADAYVNPTVPMVPQTLDSLLRAQAIFECFSSTCPSARSAQSIVRSLISGLQNTVTQGSYALPTDDPLSWDLFTSLFEDPQTTSAGLEALPTSTDPTKAVLFPPPTSHTNVSSGFSPPTPTQLHGP